jgi:uncharacterized protein
MYPPFPRIRHAWPQTGSGHCPVRMFFVLDSAVTTNQDRTSVLSAGSDVPSRSNVMNSSNSCGFLGSRCRLIVFLLFMGSYPWVFHGALRAWCSTANRVADWLPADFDETQKLMWFAEHFGSDELLMVSWKGCSWGDARLPKLAAALQQPVPQPGGEGPPLFSLVFTSPELLAELMKPPLQLSRAEALTRLEGWLIGRDGATSCLVGLVSDAGMEDRKAAVERVCTCAEKCGVPCAEVILAGPTVDGVAIDQISLNALLEINGASLAVCFLLTWLFLRSLRLAVLVFVSAVFCQQLGMAMVYYTGAQMDSVLLMIASLGFVMVVSWAVHLTNYYIDVARDHGLEGAPRRALRAALAPCMLSSVTTALGLGSLVVSKIVPIARFGWYGAAVIMAGLGIIFLWIPTALEQWPPRGWRRRRRHGRETAGDGGAGLSSPIAASSWPSRSLRSG